METGEAGGVWVYRSHSHYSTWSLLYSPSGTGLLNLWARFHIVFLDFAQEDHVIQTGSGGGLLTLLEGIGGSDCEDRAVVTE